MLRIHRPSKRSCATHAERGGRWKRALVFAVVTSVSVTGALFAVGSALTQANANTGVITVTKLENNPHSSDGNGHFIRVDGEGGIAYCAQGWLLIPAAGQKLERYGSLNIPELDYVMYHGYDGTVVSSVFGLDKGRSEAATAAAVWLAIGDKRGDVLNFIPKYSAPYHGNKGYMERWNLIKDQAVKNASWQLYQDAQAYAKNGAGGIEAGCATLWLNRTPNGQNATFDYQSVITARKKIEVRFSKVSAQVELTRENDCYKLAGASYDIFEADGGVRVGSITTDDAGKATLSLKPNTAYYAIETEAPEGFVLSNKRVDFTTRADGGNVELSDEPKTFTLIVTKRDAATQGEPQTGCSLAGAEYELSSASSSFSARATTDAKGRCQFDGIPLGTIYVREVKAPVGYLLDETVHEYIVVDGDFTDGSSLVLEPISDFDEVPIAVDIEIAKYSGDDNEGSGISEPMEEISFDVISNTTGACVGTLTTDKDGFATSAGLWMGAGTRPESCSGSIPFDEKGYTISEVEESVPADYKRADDWTIRPEELVDGARLRFIVNNTKKTSRLQVVKVDAETHERIGLPGFTFQLLDSNKVPVEQDVWYPSHERVSTFTTDETGSFHLPCALVAGTYYLREIAAPAPYLINSEDIEVMLDGNEPLAVISCPDHRAKGRVNISKTCKDDGSALNDCAFDVRAVEDIVDCDGSVLVHAGEVVDHLITSKEGYAESSDLPIGAGEAHYELVETKAAAGHAVSDEAIPFTLRYEGDTVPVVLSKLEISNEPTCIQIFKHAKGKQDTPLAGVTYEYWQDDENSARTVTTDDSGHAVLGHLVAGTWHIREKTAAAGYIIDPSIHEMEIDEHGQIEGKSTIVLELENEPTKIEVSKHDAETEQPVVGAELTVTDSSGAVVDSWTTTEEPHLIEALAPGSYTLSETKAPKQHEVADSITFTVEETSAVQTVCMYDKQLDIDGIVDKRQQRVGGLGSGHTVSYFIDAKNLSTNWVDECTITDELELVQKGLATLESVTTPIAVGDYDGKLNVWYQVKNEEDYLSDATANATRDDGHGNPWLEGEGRRLDYRSWHLWKAGISTESATTLSVKDLDLPEGSQICSIRFEFGCVSDSFCTRANGWDRKDLKDPEDMISDSEVNGSLSSAVIHLTTTATFTSNIELHNKARLDLFRNGGGEGLEDHDSDSILQKVVQALPKTGFEGRLVALGAAALSTVAGGWLHAARMLPKQRKGQ